MRPYQVPVEEIKLAAKAGFLTKSLWKKYFFNKDKSWANRKWNGFLKRKIFVRYSQYKNDDVVILNPDSKHVIEIVGNDISRPPNPYQIRHDKLVVDVIVDLFKKKKISEYYFEVELKSNPNLFSLRGVEKLPDAIAISENSTFALEVELSRKATKRYFKALEFYASSDLFNEVYFLFDSEKTKRNVAEIARKVKYPQALRPLRFGMIAA